MELRPTAHKQPPDKKTRKRREISIPTGYHGGPFTNNRYQKAHRYGPRRLAIILGEYEAKLKREAALSKKKPKNKAHGLGKVLAFRPKPEVEEVIVIKTAPIQKEPVLVWPLKNIYSRKLVA